MGTIFFGKPQLGSWIAKGWKRYSLVRKGSYVKGTPHFHQNKELALERLQYASAFFFYIEVVGTANW